MSFASLRNHALLTAAGVATAVVLPLGSTALVATSAHSVTTSTSVATAVAPPSAAQLAATKAAAKKAAKKRALAKKKAAVAARGNKIIKTAAKYKGRPYRYGGNGPSSFDCSGFTRYVVKKALHVSIPRTAAQQRYTSKVKKIKKSDRRVGDLVFFGSGHGIYHVAIYAGNGKMWDAPQTGDHVRKRAIWGSPSGYARIR